jgi:exosortase E/protease (VPEID-CTERM system)
LSPNERPAGGRTAVLLATHLLAFGLLTALTAAIWEGAQGRSEWAPLWVIAWFAAGFATVGFWLAALLPIGYWKRIRLVRHGAGIFVAALVVGIAASSAGRFTVNFWTPLAGATFWTVKSVLALIFTGVVADPATQVVGVKGFQIKVATECGGFEGIGLIWVFLAAYLWAFRGSLRFPQALWLVPIGTVVMWLANALRIVLLVAIGALWSEDVALGGFHSQAGWLAFNGVALGLVAVSRRAHAFQIEPTTPETATSSGANALSMNATAAYLGPLLALVAAVMLTTAFSAPDGASVDVLYPARIVAVAAALWMFRRAYVDVRIEWSWPAVGLGALAYAIWMALEPSAASSSRELAEGLARMPKILAGLWLTMRVGGSVVTVPIAEELAFRGYLTRRLIASDFTTVPPGRFTWLSFVVSSVLFGALHGRYVAGTLAGAIYALALYRKGSVSEAILAHATTNALIAAYVLSTGTWSLWV